MAEDDIAFLLAPYLGGAIVPDDLYAKLNVFLFLLLKWNARMNLTAIREPHEIVRRHFGESLFLGVRLPPSWTLLDLGSGAGFPGIPVQLLLPDLQVTLAESQGKKASFLQEAVRELKLSTTVWSRRVEEMPQERRFDVVTMRAVDKMEEMIPLAKARVVGKGHLALLLTGSDGVPVPESKNRVLKLLQC